MNKPRENIQAVPFGDRYIGPAEKVLIIAEIGINHEGNADVCADMIKAAAEAGADAVKLQTVDPDENYAPDTPSYKLFSQAQLSREATAGMASLARSLGTEFFTTVGDLNTFSWMERLNPAAYKISSGLLTHIPLIEQLSKTGRTLLMSTGMSEDRQVAQALHSVRCMGNDRIGLFQCTSLYPAPPETLNLKVIGAMMRKYKVPVGFSDHSLGHDAAFLAVASGACMIEKHFSLDPKRPGFDHAISLEPRGFKDMVEKVRLAERMLGAGVKVLSPEEKSNAARYHRCLVARRDIPEDVVLTEENVGVMRIQNSDGGLPPSWLSRILGRRTRRMIMTYSPIKKKDLQ